MDAVYSLIWVSMFMSALGLREAATDRPLMAKISYWAAITFLSCAFAILAAAWVVQNPWFLFLPYQVQ